MLSAFRRSGSQDARGACSEGEKDDAAKMLVALGHVRRLANPPAYWQDDALLLDGVRGEPAITLGPRQVGNDLSDLPDIFWRLTSMKHSQADLSRVFVSFTEDEVTFSAPECLVYFAVEYEMAGLTFFPGSSRGCNKASGLLVGIAKLFEGDLQSVRSYKQVQGTLTFYDAGQNVVFALTPVVTKTIENRVWRVEKYFAQGGGSDGLVDAKVLAILTFSNGRVEGSPGCGALVGDYKISGTSLSLHLNYLLAGLCLREAELQNDAVNKALQGHLQMEMRSDHVVLRDAKGQVRIQLVAY